ncbi:DnaJ-like protein subfamily B member 9 [Trichoplax sp. H2]|nr:DnaJ-like protein subfamily B member 9 [Trichoplax sp. H2]|eukprot:RDD46776.1 DnaJ-like protein subfamily B member 9 [Trichoplax sp. H2]
MKLFAIFVCLLVFIDELVECNRSKSLYDILGIRRDASDKEVKRAFRKLAIKYHPDKNKDKDSEKKFIEISKAYQILSDKGRRRYYDRYGTADAPVPGEGSYPSQDEPSFQNSAEFPDVDGFSGSKYTFFGDQDKYFDDDQLHTKDNYNYNRRGWKRKQFFSFDDLLNDDLFEDKLFHGDESIGDSFFTNFKSRFSGGRHFFNIHGPFQDDFFGNSEADAKKVHPDRRQDRFTEEFSNDESTCKTVTKRIGNIVTTETSCS